MEKPILTLYFGADQKQLMDGIIEELTPEHIESVSKSRRKSKQLEIDRIRYDITFKSIYGCYVFGHRQGIAALDVFKYLNR